MLELQGVKPGEGTLRIATTHTQARYALPKVVTAFKTRFPGVRLKLRGAIREKLATTPAGWFTPGMPVRNVVTRSVRG